jgi:hypothetical protein
LCSVLKDACKNTSIKTWFFNKHGEI